MGALCNAPLAAAVQAFVAAKNYDEIGIFYKIHCPGCRFAESQKERRVSLSESLPAYI